MYAAGVPPTAGKKIKARRVFGEAAADDLNCSLTYSPSPLKQEILKTTFENVNGTNDVKISPHEKIGPPKESNLSGAVVQHNEHGKENNSEWNKSFTGSTNVIQYQARTICAFSRSPLRPDLVKKTQDAITRANASMKSFSQAIAAGRQAKVEHHINRRTETSHICHNWKADTTEAKAMNELLEQNRRKFLSLQRQLSSKYSKEKVKREQSQRHETLTLIEQEMQLKSEVFRDQQTKLRKEKDDCRRLSALAGAKSRANIKVGIQNIRLDRLNEERAIIDERYASSIALKEALEQNKSDRRKSFAFRNGDARRIRLLHASLEQKRVEQKHQHFVVKWESENDAAEYIHQELSARRESLRNRNAAGRTLRELERMRTKNKLSTDHENYELKWAAEGDAKTYIKSIENGHRKNLQQRNLEGKRHREYLQKQHMDKLRQDQVMFELKWAGEKDTELYRLELELSRRESLAFRNKEGKRHRDFALNEQSNVAHQMHEDYELKWAAESDAKAYIAKLQNERRESLANRNMDARRLRALAQQKLVELSNREHESYELRRAAAKDTDEYVRQQEKVIREGIQDKNKERAHHSKIMDELRTLALEKESESYVLKWAAENDAKEYLSKVEKERRLSLQLRGQQVRHHRQLENEEKAEQLINLHQDELLRAEDQSDVVLYKKQCAERDRASFEYRCKDARMQRINDMERVRIHRERENQNLELETLARTDIEAYVNTCKERRRLSLAFRAKEKRKQAQWLREKKEKELEDHSRLFHDHRMNQKRLELAQQKERAQLILNAIKHTGFSVKSA
jgi:hypothetical protein